MKILCLGHATYDITLPIDAFPIENKKYRFTNKIEGGGGSAANAAFLLGRWKMEVLFAGVVGYDQYGTKIKETLQRNGVDVRNLETNYEHSTNLSLILANQKNHSRTVLSITAEDLYLKKSEFEFDPDIILMDGYDYPASRSVIEKHPKAITVIDAGRADNDTIELCKRVKYIVCSKDFAETVSGITIDYKNTATLVTIYQKLKNRFPHAEIIITLEEHGALYCINNQIKVMPGLSVEAKDTTGAGDIFHGAFVYGLANNFDLEKIVKIANIAAGLSVSTIGAQLSMPSLEDVLKYYEEHK